MGDTGHFGIYYRNRDPVSGMIKLHRAHVERASYFDGTKPTVIVLPGFATTRDLGDYFEKRVSGVIKCVEEALGRSGQRDRANIFCVAYTHQADRQHVIPYIFGHAVQLHPTEPDEQRFVEQVLLPMAGFHNGAKPDVDTACRNLSRLTLIGHSSGCSFAAQVVKLFRKALHERGYGAGEIDRISQEVVTIGLGSGMPLQQDTPGFRIIGINAQCDRRLWRMREANDTDHRRDYEAAGYDAALMEQRLPQLEQTEYWPRSDKPWRKNGTNGPVFFYDLPNRLSWREPTGKRSIEISDAPEHALTMFCRAGETPKGKIGNAHLVNKVSAVLANAVARDATKDLQSIANDTPPGMRNARASAPSHGRS